MKKIKFFNRLNWIIIILLLFICQVRIYSQNKDYNSKDKYAIQQWLNKYNRSKQVTMVVLDKDLMDAKRNEFMGVQGVNSVTAMVIKKPSRRMTLELEKVIEEDKSDSNDIQEVFMDGYLISAYYKLSNKSADATYLLYRYDLQRGRITLVLLSGHINNKQLLHLLVNNKTSKR